MDDHPGIRFLEHDADLGFEVEGDDLLAVWDLGARALVGVMTDVAEVAPAQRVQLVAEAPDHAALWVASLTELLLAFELDGLLLVAVEQLEVEADGAQLRARFTACGEPYDPARHPADTGIKAVTHHGAALSQDDRGRWRGRVLLDL